MSDAPHVSVVVLSYNGEELLPLVLSSLRRQTFPDFSVTIVDNGSEDESVALLRRDWPEVEIVRLERNVGVAGALNRGIEATSGELVALLNNDVELDPGWMTELVDAMVGHPEVASASGKMLRFAERDVIDAAGDTMRWSGAFVNRGTGERDRGQYDRAEPIFSACAGAAMYRRSALGDIGLFDEDFVAYMEDADWGFRAQLRGQGSWYSPHAIAFHMRGATTGRRKGTYMSLQRRNQLWLIAKNFPAAALIRHLPQIVTVNLALLVQDARAGLLGSTLRGWWAALVGMPRVMRKRRDIQARRTVGVAALDALVTREPWARGSVRDRWVAARSAARRVLGGGS